MPVSEPGDSVLAEKLGKLRRCIEKLDSPVGIGFSGGVDSAFLLSALLKWSRYPVIPFCVISPFISSYQKGLMEKTAQHIGIEPAYIYWNALDDEAVCSNNALRCYFCKKRMYTLMLQAGKRKGAGYLIDGTHADDISSHRPGLRALEEMGVLIPMADAGLRKHEIRYASRKWGLTFWNRKSESCMATRIERNNRISIEILNIIEKLEDFLRLKRINPKRIRIINKSIYIFVETYENECMKMYFEEIERIDERFTFFLKN